MCELIVYHEEHGSHLFTVGVTLQHGPVQVTELRRQFDLFSQQLKLLDEDKNLFMAVRFCLPRYPA